MREPVQSASTFSEQPFSISLRRFVVVLFRHKLLITELFVGVFSLVACAILLTPRQYESRMKILVKNERADLVVSPDARDLGQVPPEVSENQVNSEIELLFSNDLLSRVVRSCRLYEQTAGRVQAASFQAGGGPQSESFERAVRKLGRDLKITPVRKTNIIAVTYSARSPESAAAVLKELSAAYLDAHLRVHGTAGTTKFFRAQAGLYEAQLHEAESRLSEFRKRKNLTSIAGQEDLIVRKVVDSEAALRETDAALAETSARMRQLRTQIAAQNPRILTQSRAIPNQNSVERLNTMLTELENRRIQSLMKFRPEDRIVIEIEQEIANTRAALDREAKLAAIEQATDVNPLRQTLEADLARAQLQETGLRARREALASTLGSYRGHLMELESASVDYDTLERAVKETGENYLLYAKKKEEARIADLLDQQKIANVAIVEAPVEQHLPAKSNRAFKLALGVFLAGFVSLGAAFIAEYAFNRFYTAAELEQSIKVPVLVSIPYEK
jgi:uncharacterized protein involved in exopolysaccharide biosynthesis